MSSSQYSINKSNHCRDDSLGSSDIRMPQCKKVKQQSRKSIQFFPKVSMQCYIQHDWQEQRQDSAQVAKNKIHTKALSKLWRSKHNAQTSDRTSAVSDANIIGHAVRCEIMGESLRGLEHFTDASIGRMRLRVKDEATRAAMAEQRVQPAGNITCSPDVNDNGNGSKADDGRPTKAYGAMTQEALAYAKLVAQEDAKVAAEILAEDLPGVAPTSSLARCNPSLIEVLSVIRAMEMEAGTGRLTDEFINSFLMDASFLEQSVAALCNHSLG